MNKYKQKIVEIVQSVIPLEASYIEPLLAFIQAKSVIDGLFPFLHSFDFVNDKEAEEYLREFGIENYTHPDDFYLANSLRRKSLKNQLIVLIPAIQVELDLINENRSKKK
jgi:hypothetical protein